MLVYNFIVSGIEDLIYISTNIGEAIKSYRESTKQLFLFDDFLGKNFLEDKLDRNEDQELISFIKKIKSSRNKYFIMTTREYILKQAQQKYELLSRHDLDIAKCIMDLSLYTPIVKANILYNHLFFSNMPKEYLQELAKAQRYLAIINHKNYNPRIIEAILNTEEWNCVPSDLYYDKFLSYFNNSESVWRYAFEQQISRLGKIIIIVLGSINGLIGLDNLKVAVKNHIKSDDISFDIDFNTSLRELAGSFIRTEKDDKNIYALEYFNPSIADFIHTYFLENRDILKLIIENCTYLDQIITAYQIFNGPVPDEIKIISEDTISRRFNDLNIIKLKKSRSFDQKVFFEMTSENTSIDKLYYVSRYLFPLLDENLLIREKDRFFNEIKNTSNNLSLEIIVDIYLSFREHTEIDDFVPILENLIAESDSIYDLLAVAKLKDIDKEKFDEIIKKEYAIKKVNEIARYEFDNVDGSYEYTRDFMLDISDYFDIDLDQYINDLNERIDDEKRSEERIEVHKSFLEDDVKHDEEKKIKDLFNTLLLSRE
jgi:hypothetical protein